MGIPKLNSPRPAVRMVSVKLPLQIQQFVSSQMPGEVQSQSLNLIGELACRTNVTKIFADFLQNAHPKVLNRKYGCAGVCCLQ